MNISSIKIQGKGDSTLWTNISKAKIFLKKSLKTILHILLVLLYLENQYQNNKVKYDPVDLDH